MPMKSLFAATLDESILSKKQNSLKMLLKRIFNKCIGHDTSTKSDSPTEISGENDLNISVVTIDENFEIPEYDEVLNPVILVNKVSKENRARNNEQNEKIERANITGGKYELSDGRTKMMSGSNTPLTKRKRGNRQPCVINELDYDLLFPHVENEKLSSKTWNQEQSGLHIKNISSSKKVLQDSKDYINPKTLFGEAKELSRQLLESEQHLCTSNIEKHSSFPLLDSIDHNENIFKGSKLRLIDAPTIFIPKPKDNISKPTPWRSYSPQYLPMGRTNNSMTVYDVIMGYQEIINSFTKKYAKRNTHKKSVSFLDEIELVDATDFSSNIFHHVNQKGEIDEATTRLNFVESFDGRKQDGEYVSRGFDSSENTFNVNSTTLPVKHEGSTTESKTQQSGESSQISTLLSDSKFDVYSLYSTVNKSAKKKRTVNPAVCPQPSKDSDHRNIEKVIVTDSLGEEKRPSSPLYLPSNDSDYVSIDFKIDLKVDELTREISKLRGIVGQVWKAINTCKNDSKLYGSPHHIEAEKILLFSTCKMEILNNELNKDENEVPNERSCGTIVVDGLRFLRKPDIKVENETEQYYLCIIHSGTTVIASDIASTEKTGKVTFKDSYYLNFDAALSELEVKISIYSVNIQKRRRIQENVCFSPRKIYSPKKAKRESNNSTLSERSPVRLLGSSRIGVRELSCEDKFKLINMPLNAPLSETFEANVAVNVRLNNNFSGFLTVYTKYTLWNRRWCVLDGFLLKYWSCSSHEKEMSPLRIIDLQKCATISKADESISFQKANTFVLEFKSKDMFSSEPYFFSADTMSDFMEWKQHIDRSITMNRSWRKLKCPTVFLNN